MVEAFDMAVTVRCQHIDGFVLGGFVNVMDCRLIVCEYPKVKELVLACPGVCKVKHLLNCKQLCIKYFHFIA